MMAAMEINEEQENKELLKLYRKVMRKAREKGMLQAGDALTIKRAFKFAVEAHKDMRRKSGEPFIFHPVQVALIVVDEIGLGPTAIVAALLHDVVEDTAYTLADIERMFGKKVADIIDGLTKIKVTEKLRMDDSMQAENFKKMLLTISKDIRVVLIKIADRLHNMRTLDSMPRHKRLKIRSETQHIYAPLAHRLGLYAIKTELEDLGLKYSDPDAYNEIEGKIYSSKPERNRFFRSFVKPLELALKKKKDEHPGMTYSIKERRKSTYSIYRKMQKQKIPFEQVYDFFAIRIIIKGEIPDEKLACWEVYSIVTDCYTPNTHRLRDWVSMPRENGYESLHVTVMGPNGQWVEVQVRTERMDEIAEKGFAAHWRYKELNKNNSSKRRQAEMGLEAWIARVREMLEQKDVDAIEFVDSFRANLYQDELYAFTPKGDLKRLPTDSSVLDFAFDVHTEVGLRCMGAKVNGRLVPLHHKLQNGDQVEILTSNGNQIKANQDWLKYVVTSRARAKIREYLREDRKRVAVAGREIVDRKFKQMKVPFNDRNALRIAQLFGQKTETDFYYQVGIGAIDHTQIKKFKEQLENPTKELKPVRVDADPKKAFEQPKDDELVVGDRTTRLDYKLAPCCAPIPGDPIFGFVTIGEGIKVHRTNCPNSISLMSQHGHRVIKARWSSSTEQEFDVSLIIEGTDRKGLAQDVTKLISGQMQLNIKSILLKSDTGIFRGTIELSVHDSGELNKLIQELNAVKGVLQVTRVEEKA
jgi:GTP pyrophosphokinase